METKKFELTEEIKNRSPYGRKVVAENPRTPADILAELAKDSNTNVRKAAARNPKTPKV